MTRRGFHLVQLRITGPEVEPAEIQFSPGLNVISGPSDTGKTYILRCIDYMLGGRTPPDHIPEAASYDMVQLDLIALSNDERFTLSRSLRGGAFTLLDSAGGERTLGDRHHADQVDTVSHFLLNLTGLVGKVIRKNASGETQSLSFRNLAHLAIVSEESVIQAHSPIDQGNPVTRTAERSVFRLLLTGLDDSSVVALEDRRISRARLDAQGEVIEQILSQIREQLTELGTEHDAEPLRGQLERLDTTLTETDEQLSSVGSSVTQLEERRRDAWNSLRRIDSRLEVLRGLTERFRLLAEQYNSDLLRLDAIVEASSQLSQFGIERCPVCGAAPEHHDESHREGRADPKMIATSSAAEATRIRSLIGDLAVTRRELDQQSAILTTERSELSGVLSDLSSTLAERFRPQVRELTGSIEELRNERARLTRALDLIEQLSEIDAIAAGLRDQPSSARSATAAPRAPSMEFDEFALESQERLAAWNYPDLDRVTFSDSDWDLQINGRSRTSHGKGVRAVTHAAFTTALLRYCAQRDLPHPGFVLIDSPLVVYKEPDTGEQSFSRDVKGSFFQDLATTFAGQQVIVLENEIPPPELIDGDQLRLVRFTKSDEGRYGFIPKSTQDGS